MRTPTITGVAAIFALGASAAATTDAASNIVVAQPLQWTKSSDGFSQYICNTKGGFRKCLVDNKLVPFQSATTQMALTQGQFHIIFDGSTGAVADSTSGGDLKFTFSPTGYALQCAYDRPRRNLFTCYNGRGQEFLWYTNPDDTVGLGLTVPDGATPFEAHWIGGH